MDINPLALEAGQLAIVVAILWGIQHTTTRRLNKYQAIQSRQGERLAVLDNISSDVKSDHDKLILVEASTLAAHRRLDEMKVGGQ